MPIAVQCSGCGGTFCAPDGAAGKRVKCPKCSAVIEICDSQAHSASQTRTPDATELQSNPPDESSTRRTAQAANATAMSKGSCPTCGSADVKSVPPPGFALTFSSDKQCKSCGTVWRPAWTKFGGILAIIVGAIPGFGGIALLIGALLQGTGGGGGARDSAAAVAAGVNATGMVFGVLIGVVGIAFVCYGIGVVNGKLGKQTIVKPARRK